MNPLIILIALAAFIFILSRFLSASAGSIRKARGILAGKIEYTDLLTPARALISETLGLKGKPDYIVKNDEGRIPVEFKSGAPDSPYSNHIQQLTAYCALVEDNYQDKVPYGALVYENGQLHKISYNPLTKAGLTTVLNNMRAAIKNGTAHRNHSSSAKCTSCSVREYCNQKVI